MGEPRATLDVDVVADLQASTVADWIAELGPDFSVDKAWATAEWFRSGGEVSDRQWRDVLGVLKTQQASLDVAELDLWAERCAVLDLLVRAKRQAGLGGPSTGTDGPAS